MKYDNIRVGLGLVLIQNGKVLLSQRKSNDNGFGEYGGPGGALQPGESLKASILRELIEECGADIKLDSLRTVCTISYRNDQSTTHWIGVGFCAEYVSGNISNSEPDKHTGWAWYDLASLPNPLYWPMAKYIEAYKTGVNLFEL